MQKPILETYLFTGGGLDGLYLSVEKGVRIVTCIEVRDGEEKKHCYELVHGLSIRVNWPLHSSHSYSNK